MKLSCPGQGPFDDDVPLGEPHNPGLAGPLCGNDPGEPHDRRLFELHKVNGMLDAAVAC